MSGGFERTSNANSVHLPSPHTSTVTAPTTAPPHIPFTGPAARAGESRPARKSKIKGLFSFTSTYVCIGIGICFLVVLQVRYTYTKEQKIAQMGFQNWYFANSMKTKSEQQVAGGSLVSGIGLRPMAKSIGPDFPQATRLVSKLQ